MILRQLLSILVLPFTVAVVVPFVALRQSRGEPSLAAQLSGGLLILAGLTLVVHTIRHFASRGRGTLAPWDPPRRLVVSGIYRYVRNPMISGVLSILVGESLLLGSTAVAVWAATFFALNATYIPLIEEPGLVRRFGAAYESYKQHVPRWIPRGSPWQPPACPEERVQAPPV